MAIILIATAAVIVQAIGLEAEIVEQCQQITIFEEIDSVTVGVGHGHVDRSDIFPPGFKFYLHASSNLQIY